MDQCFLGAASTSPPDNTSLTGVSCAHDGAVQDALYAPDQLHQLMAESDYIVMATPYTPSTHHLVDAAAIAAMKPTGVLVNVGRGKCIDETALIEGIAPLHASVSCCVALAFSGAADVFGVLDPHASMCSLHQRANNSVQSYQARTWLCIAISLPARSAIGEWQGVRSHTPGYGVPSPGVHCKRQTRAETTIMDSNKAQPDVSNKGQPDDSNKAQPDSCSTTLWV
jgi:hypothetical protein